MCTVWSNSVIALYRFSPTALSSVYRDIGRITYERVDEGGCRLSIDGLPPPLCDNEMYWSGVGASLRIGFELLKVAGSVRCTLEAHDRVCFEFRLIPADAT